MTDYVTDMINTYLADHEYDGLYLEGECACMIYDLAPCGQIQLECQAGYLGPGEGDCEFSIGAERDPLPDVPPEIYAPHRKPAPPMEHDDEDLDDLL